MVLGDSISAAYGIDVDAGWVRLLERHLQSDGNNGDSEANYRVINASISGETTAGALVRLPALLRQHRPVIIIVELGANDGLRGFPIAEFRDNLDRLVKLSQQSGARVLIAGMHIPPNYGGRYTRLFYDSYTITAHKFNVSLIPFLLEEIAIYPELMQADGLHPTADAQQRILQNVLPHLKPLL